MEGDYCQPHSVLCLDSCSENLPIDDVLRYRLYVSDYGWQLEGTRLYARLRAQCIAVRGQWSRAGSTRGRRRRSIVASQMSLGAVRPTTQFGSCWMSLEYQLTRNRPRPMGDVPA